MSTNTPSTVHQVLSSTLRDHQKAKGISQEELRRSVGLSRQTMTNVFKGTEDFKVSTLAGVANELGLEVALVRKSDGQVVTNGQDADIEPRWMVFNAGTPVASEVTLKEALQQLTPERLKAGWAGVSVLNKDTLSHLLANESSSTNQELSLKSILLSREESHPAAIETADSAG